MLNKLSNKISTPYLEAVIYHFHMFSFVLSPADEPLEKTNRTTKKLQFFSCVCCKELTLNM